MPRRNSSLLSPPMLIISLPIIALLLLFFLLHPFLSNTSHIILPNSVKKSYSLDSINIILVVFAILCGVFAKGNDDGNNNSNTENENGVCKENYDSTPNPQPWFEVSERKVYSEPLIRAEESGGGGQMRRNSSSYPDLRNESMWGNNERFSFFDDFEINKYRSPAAAVHDQVPPLQRWRSEIEEKEIPVDTFLVRSSPPVPSTPPLATPPPHTAADDRLKRKRSYQSVGRKERVEKVSDQSPSTPEPTPHTAETSRHKPRRTHHSVGRKEKVIEKKSPPTPPPPPPRPPPSPPVRLAFRSEQKQGKLERRKSNATKEIKMVLASLYNNRKRKRKEKITKSHENIDNLLHFPPESSHFEIPATPPPPPPPPPPSVFHSIFKIKSKRKKIHSVPQPPPPPSPPKSEIPSSTRKIHSPPPPPAPPNPPPESSRRQIQSSSRKPPFPVNLSIGSQSPINQIPSPPPPPPFKIQSANSSRCSSPGLDVESPSNPSTAISDGVNKDGITNGGSVFCPSPDVNVKADTFIARLRGNWQLEKINSLREKRNAGHGP